MRCEWLDGLNALDQPDLGVSFRSWMIPERKRSSVRVLCLAPSGIA
jgi:hypothetical protein